MWNNKFTVKPAISISEFVPVVPQKNIDDIFIIKEYRKIRNDHTFSYGNKMYLIKSKLKYSIAKQEIEIRKKDDDNFTAYFANNPLVISRVCETTKPSMYDLEIQKKIDAIELADKLGNVAKAARISGCSRKTIYKNRRLLREKGPMALKRSFTSDQSHLPLSHQLTWIYLQIYISHHFWSDALLTCEN